MSLTRRVDELERRAARNRSGRRVRAMRGPDADPNDMSDLWPLDLDLGVGIPAYDERWVDERHRKWCDERRAGMVCTQTVHQIADGPAGVELILSSAVRHYVATSEEYAAFVQWDDGLEEHEFRMVAYLAAIGWLDRPHKVAGLFRESLAAHPPSDRSVEGTADRLAAILMDLGPDDVIQKSGLDD